MELIAQLVGIVGDAHVLTGDDAAAYGKDWTGKYTCQPRAVLRPANRDQVCAIMRLASDTGTPVVPVSGKTGLAGGAFADGALMLSLERMNAIREIRPDARVAVVEAGVILSSLHDAAEAQDLIFPLTFGARGSAMVGGVLATNAGGSNVVRYGNTRDLCLGLEVVLPDGRVMDLMSELHKDNTGYDLKDLFIGAEGTLGIITAAVLKLRPKPRAYATAMVAVPTLGDALSLLNRLQEETGGAVEAFEYMPAEYMARLAECRPDLRPVFAETHAVNILVEVGATAPRDAAPQPDGSIPVATQLEEALADMLENGALLDAVVAQTQAQRAEMWERREAAAEITFSRLPLVDNDIALPLDAVGIFLERMETRLGELDKGADTITVGHLGDGNLHYAIWPSRDDAALIDTLREAVEDIVADLRGSFSAEHGIGLSKLATMRRRKDGVALDMMAQIKAAFDPTGIMNPGKLLPS
ncbi:FAD-binding oxidoreductase [Actibacterium lipolyticum]|uniref:Putative FAD-linked oxidoreductase n=1 Tax=Actibacterium lipolyticum TaxID=1524263 RepID=A0A238KQU9_9RHOB|nr:FAD-binding oxidoreductase [Actibacterium lipolyticum]SMX45001.1 putative FAD-linked oxidoreductase [Actibacterium lipolyticum]